MVAKCWRKTSATDDKVLIVEEGLCNPGFTATAGDSFYLGDTGDIVPEADVLLGDFTCHLGVFDGTFLNLLPNYGYAAKA